MYWELMAEQISLQTECPAHSVSEVPVHVRASPLVKHKSSWPKELQGQSGWMDHLRPPDTKRVQQQPVCLSPHSPQADGQIQDLWQAPTAPRWKTVSPRFLRKRLGSFSPASNIPRSQISRYVALDLGHSTRPSRPNRCPCPHRVPEIFSKRAPICRLHIRYRPTTLDADAGTYWAYTDV